MPFLWAGHAQSLSPGTRIARPHASASSLKTGGFLGQAR